MTHKISDRRIPINRPDSVKLVGFDGTDYHLVDVDSEGSFKQRMMLWNPDVSQWEPVTKGSQGGLKVSLENFPTTLGINPHVDLDTTIIWTGGKSTQIEVVGLGKTKTMTLSWTGDELNSIATVIT